MNKPILVSIESPYHNTNPIILQKNINYAIMAMKDSAKNYNEIPYLSHLLLTQVVINGNYMYTNDNIIDHFGIGRDNAINLTNELRKRVDKIVFYIDFGYSNGMNIAKQIAIDNNILTEERYLPATFMNNILSL